MNEKITTYIKYTYQSTIALGWLGIVASVSLMLLNFFSDTPFNSVVVITSFVVGIVFLLLGKKLKKNKQNIPLVKKYSKQILILSIIGLLFAGNLLAIILIIYTLIILKESKKELKNNQ